MSRSEGDSYRPQYGADPGPPPPPPAYTQDAMYHFQGNGIQPRNRRDGGQRNNATSRPPRSFKFRAPPPSERPLFSQGYMQESSELTFGGDGAEDKFRNPDDLTDTDETDMDLSVDEEDENTNDTDPRPSKRTRINEQGDAAESLPKWSNPDPYTALPPVDQDSRKKTNVVNFIRKARKTATIGTRDTSLPHDDDFISFDLDDDEGPNVSMAPPNAPLGPRLGRHEVVPSKLGKRTRAEFENTPLVTTRFGQQYHSDGRVLQIWRADADVDPSPWVKNIVSPADSAGVALHKEVVDFYTWVQPKDYEVAVRGSVLHRLEQALLRINPGGKLEAFGSYAAGLYLPVGDMDLVFLEKTFRPRATPDGLPPKPARKFFERTAKFIRDQGLARPGSVNPIWFAKVPIIKFIENVSGLKVDLSFNNDTGVVANGTFQTWRKEYPAMPIITSIIKQFLMIRGLNDVASGGLGGFSVICLVTSLLQHMPKISQPANLGQTLVEFFNLYGKLFNRQQVAIRLDPPGYIDVATYGPFQFSKDKPDRLKIIDPNRPENNISGGTNKIGLIFDCFATAHDILQECLTAHDNGQAVSSFLEQIVGGNFEAYDTQREFLRELHIGPIGMRAPAVLLPSPPSPPSIANRRQEERSLPPPPPAAYQALVPLRTRSSVSSHDSHAGPLSLVSGLLRGTENDTGSTELSQTVKRVQFLRPALKERAGNATSMQDLASIGGYPHVHSMLSDLAARDGTTRSASFQPKPMSSSPDNSVKADPPKWNTEAAMEWNRERTRRYRPELTAAIDQCKSKKELAAVCGFDGPSILFTTMSSWEKDNGFHEGTQQHKVALIGAAAAVKSQRGGNAKNPKGLNPKKARKNKQSQKTK